MLSAVKDLIQDLHAGKMIILVDDEQRENEGDLVLAADHVSKETINFMAQYGRGLICLALTKKQIKQLQLPLMVAQDKNFSPHKTAFTLSIEAAQGVSTGISAEDRAHTIKIASSNKAKPEDIVTPGHIFPIQAQDGGVLRRAGHTEAGVDLAKLAGLTPAAVICEIMKTDGSMARMPDLQVFAKKHKIKIGSIVDMISFRLQNETIVKEIAQYKTACLGCKEVQVKIFSNTLDKLEHLVLQFGDIHKNQEPVLVRIQKYDPIEGLLNEESSLNRCVKRIQELGGVGILVLLGNENKNENLSVKVNRVIKNNFSKDTTPSSDKRDYGIGAQILRSLNIRKIRLISNTGLKSSHSTKPGLRAYGLSVVQLISLKNNKNNRLNNIVKLDKNNYSEKLW